MTLLEDTPDSAGSPRNLADYAREQVRGAKRVDADESVPTPETPPSVPQKIGPYRILETLGEGGMGTVYLAEQEEPLKRRVAIKVIKLGMDTKSIVARFESERQALALMNHPNIASVFDAGATDDGRPFFVMEHVPGERITDYCDQRRMTTEERLRLFMQVCEAVQHAHQKAVIHRDIKPSNILVVEQDGKPHPKIIDFAVAKATEQEPIHKTRLTEHGNPIGTPQVHESGPGGGRRTGH